MCIDFTSLNKACPKDDFPLPCIDQIMDSTSGSARLCFMDTYSGYHQVWMAEDDEAHTNFITPFGTYCYVRMLFGLRNAGATFARLVQIVFEAQVGRNLEAYVDDIVVKSKHECDLIADLRETFSNLRRTGLRLNPEKCTFGVQFGKLLGYLVSRRGIEANPDKIRAIREMEPPP
ncbi:unnamed protein product [Urochloa humidicola]